MMRKKMGAVTYLRAFGSRLTPTDKKLSNTLALKHSSPLKLFLVILVLFGMTFGVNNRKWN